MDTSVNPPGHPGLEPRWTSRANCRVTPFTRCSRPTLGTGMLPEQVWDTHDIPAHRLRNGHPSGSGMPLVWAHSEYIKLTRSLNDGAVFDMPPQTVQRYLRDKTGAPFLFWRFEHQLRELPQGKNLRLEVLAPARVHRSSDAWQSSSDAETQDSQLGVHFVDLPVNRLSTSASVEFTFFWPQANRWEGQNFAIKLLPPKP